MRRTTGSGLLEWSEAEVIAPQRLKIAYASHGKALGHERLGGMARTSTSAAVVPLARPETWTTFPRELAPLIDKPPFSPIASRNALSAMPRLSLGADEGALVSRALRERDSALNMSCFHVSFTLAFGGRWFRFWRVERRRVRNEGA